MNGYFLNDVFIRYEQNIKITNFFKNYLFKNRLNPSSNSYRIDDNKVILLYNDISYEFPTNQNVSLIDYYNARYTDLYSCCFNTSQLKVYLPNNNSFNLPNGIIKPITPDYTHQCYNIANPNINCNGISENECIFFYRWYCKGLRDLVGYDKMSKYDSNCNCYIFNPNNQINIKIGTPVNCYDTSCQINTSVIDPVLTTQICQSNICTNMLVIKDILAGQNIDINNISLNLSCK